MKEVCPITRMAREELEQIWEPPCCSDKGHFISRPDLFKLLTVTNFDLCPCCHKGGLRENARVLNYRIPAPELVRNFHDRVAKGDIRGVQECISAGCDVNMTRDEDWRLEYGFIIPVQQSISLLLTAIREKQYDVFSLLLQQEDILVNLSDQTGNTPLLLATEIAATQKDRRFFDALLKRPDILFNQSNQEGGTALATAAQYGFLSGVQALLQKFPTIHLNAEGEKDTTTPLLYACQGNPKTMMALLYGDQEEYEEIVDLLLQQPGIDVNKATPDGATPLMIAIAHHHFTVAFKLLAHPNILVNQRGQNGDTALMTAVDHMQMDLILALLSKGADVTIVASDGATPISIVRKHITDPKYGHSSDLMQAILNVLLSYIHPSPVTLEIQTTLKWATLFVHHGHQEEALHRMDVFLLAHSDCPEILSVKNALLYARERREKSSSTFFVPRGHVFGLTTEKILQLGMILASQDRHLEALSRYDLFLQNNANCPVILGAKGAVLYTLERYDEALLPYNLAIENQRNDACLYYGRGVVKVALRRYKEGEKDYRVALELSPNDPSILSNLGAALLLQHESQEALDYCLRSLNIRPNHIKTLNNKAVAFTQLERYDDALETYQYVLKLDSKNAKALEETGILLQYLGREEEAFQYYNRHLEGRRPCLRT